MPRFGRCRALWRPESLSVWRQRSSLPSWTGRSSTGRLRARPLRRWRAGCSAACSAEAEAVVMVAAVVAVGGAGCMFSREENELGQALVETVPCC